MKKEVIMKVIKIFFVVLFSKMLFLGLGIRL